MATTAYGVNNALARKAWAKKLYVEALKQTRYAQFKGRSGTDSLVSLKTDLAKDRGDKLTIGLRMQLTGNGVTGDSTLEGNEEALSTYSDSITIDQLRHAVRSAGKMSEQRVTFEVRDEAMSGLRDWLADRIDMSLFNQLAGATTNQTGPNTLAPTGTGVSAFTGMQSCIAPDSNHIFSSSATHDNTTEASLSLTTTFALNLIDIDRAVAKAKTLTPAIRPLKVNGDNKYVLFIHPYQTYLLRSNTNTGQWNDIMKAKLTGGQINDNPLITGLLGEYNNTLLVEDARVPCIGATAGGGAATNYRRAIFCGAQAASIAFGAGTGEEGSWTEELFDYGNQLGVSVGLIWGLKKMVFNSTDFSTIVISSYAPAV